MRLINPKQIKLSQYCLSNFLVLLIIIFFSLKCEANEDLPPRVGNFALPFSQQPSPLIGFGDNIIDKNEIQLYLFGSDYRGINKHFIDVVPSVLYGITSHLSIFINTPYAASYQIEQQKSTGFEDAFAQLEYAFYDHATKNYVEQATVVVNMTVPTGSIQKSPPTGMGSPSYFVGATFNRTYPDWFLFGAPGATLTTAKNGTKFGNSYLYQFGFGKNIATRNGWIFAWMTEIDGTYSQQNRVQGLIDPDSGGNVIYVTPSIWASTKKLILQFGVGFPVTQHLYGDQTRDTFLLAVNVGWSIY